MEMTLNGDTPGKPKWKRSSKCANGACIEVATGTSTLLPRVLVRDSKRVAAGDEATRLSFTPGAWAGFLDAVKKDELRPVG